MPQPCANESHAHHHGLDDSIWEQWRRVHDTFRSYMSHGAFNIGMPGHWLEGGQAKYPGGYDEMDWSLPRWLWIHRQREYFLSDPNNRDQFVPNAVRYFITPIVVYHPTEAGDGASCWCNDAGCGCSSWQVGERWAVLVCIMIPHAILSGAL